MGSTPFAALEMREVFYHDLRVVFESWMNYKGFEKERCPAR
jgi:hypothetical protein